MTARDQRCLRAVWLTGQSKGSCLQRDGLLHTRRYGRQQATRPCPLQPVWSVCAGLPEHIDMGQFLADFGDSNVRTQSYLHSMNSFLRDMESANDERFWQSGPGSSVGSLLFFPGCQLAASDPRYVEVT